jgi:hypothetical protein
MRKYFISAYIPERNCFESGVFSTELDLSTSEGMGGVRVELERDLIAKEVKLLFFNEIDVKENVQLIPIVEPS